MGENFRKLVKLDTSRRRKPWITIATIEANTGMCNTQIKTLAEAGNISLTTTSTYMSMHIKSELSEAQAVTQCTMTHCIVCVA